MTPERLAQLKEINAQAYAAWPFAHGPWMLDTVNELIAEVERGHDTFQKMLRDPEWTSAEMADALTRADRAEAALATSEELFVAQVIGQWHCQGLKQVCDEQHIDGRNADEVVASIGRIVRPIVAQRDAALALLREAHECVVCHADLHPEALAPHCFDCVVDDEHSETWDEHCERLAALIGGTK